MPSALIISNPHARILAKYVLPLLREPVLGLGRFFGSAVELRLSPGAVYVTACRWGTWVRLRWDAECDVDQDIAVQVDGVWLAGALGNHDGSAELHYDGTRIELRAGESVRGVAIPEQFTEMPFPKQLVATAGRGAKEAIQRASKFAGNTQQRFSGNAWRELVVLEREDDGAVVVATDGYRMAVELPSDLRMEVERVFIPVGLVRAMHWMSAPKVDVYADEGKEGKVVGLQANGVWLWTTVGTNIEYPNWRGLVPGSWAVRVRVSVRELRDACARIAKKARDVYVQYDDKTSMGMLAVEWNGQRVGWVYFSMEGGKQLPRFRVPVKHLKDALDALRGCCLRAWLGVNDPERRPIGLWGPERKQIYLIAPMLSD